MCDRCNNTSLAVLDEALCEFLPIQMFRVAKGIPTKAGKLPVARFHAARVETDGAGLVKILVNNPRDTWTFRETSRSAGEVRLRLSGEGGRKLTPDYVSRLSRAVLKSALECAWLDHGEAVLGHEFDHVREAILGTPRDGFVVVPRRGEPDDDVSLTYHLVPEAGRTRLAVVASIFGMALATDSGLDLPIDPLPEDSYNVMAFKARELRR